MTGIAGAVESLEKGAFDVEPMGSDILRCVKEQVSRASSCIPAICTESIDTQLLFAYCHRICDESMRETMHLKVMVVEEAFATLVRIPLSYNQSAQLSLRDLLQRKMRGVCFAWTEKEGEPGGFRINAVRLAPIFYAFYLSSETGRTLDCLHSSPSQSSTVRERYFWVPEAGTDVTGIVCAPLDAYHRRPSHLTYTFGLKEEGKGWRHETRKIPFVPAYWVKLNDLFQTAFEPSLHYVYRIKGPKGKGWLLTQTPSDFNLHHL